MKKAMLVLVLVFLVGCSAFPTLTTNVWVSPTPVVEDRPNVDYIVCEDAGLDRTLGEDYRIMSMPVCQSKYGITILHPDADMQVFLDDNISIAVASKTIFVMDAQTQGGPHIVTDQGKYWYGGYLIDWETDQISISRVKKAPEDATVLDG